MENKRRFEASNKKFFCILSKYTFWCIKWDRLVFKGSRKIPPGKIATRKIATHQTPPWKNHPPENSHPENFHQEYSHPFYYLSFFTMSSFNTSSINGRGGNVHVHPPRMKNFDMSRTAQCSHLRKNSNNQRKLTMSSDRFPSWNLSFVNIEYC